MHAPLRWASSRMSNTVAPDACEISQLDRDRARRGLVALPAEHERLELDLDRLLADLARAQAKRSQIQRRHPLSVARSTAPEVD